MSPLLRSRRPHQAREAEVTDRGLFLRRRDLLAGAGALAAGTVAGGLVLAACGPADAADAAAGGSAGPRPDLGPFDTAEEPTSKRDATRYNNCYEFGTGKKDPARNAGSLRTSPWSVVVSGEVAKPGRVPLETLLAPHTPEERIYRLRCVEAWSMVIPWLGIPLADVLARFEPTSKAKYVAFETLHDPEQMPGQKRSILDWPYREALRLDEAMHPLSLLATGMYGETLPNQNGAPLRLVVPWKYGFKSIKSIVAIRLLAEQPVTTWSYEAPNEYGFYANVNPSVDHPRWSQKRERRIGELRKRPTLPFNGYAELVAPLYAGMNLAKQF